MLLDSEQRDALSNQFRMYGLLSMWEAINNEFDRLRFTDKLNDKEKIEEYQWITTQINRYISKHQAEIESAQTAQDTLEVLTSLIAKAQDCNKDRRSLIYQSLRDMWLINTYNLVAQFDDTEEEENGWTD